MHMEMNLRNESGLSRPESLNPHTTMGHRTFYFVVGLFFICFLNKLVKSIIDEMSFAEAAIT